MDDANREKCPLCGSPTAHACTSTDYISGERFSIVACLSCGLGQTAPPVSIAEIGRYYGLGYYKKRKSGADSYINRTRLRKVSRVARGKKRILDVGCGNGALIEIFESAGWNANGIEMAPPEHFVSEAVQKKVFIGDVRDASFPAHSFDVITLFHVLEHMMEPKESLQKVRALLADDGLLIVEVPSLASWQARLTGGKWFNLDVPRHVFHFTPRSLTLLLEQSGFRVERLSHYSPIYSYYGFVQSLLNLTTRRNNILFDLLNGKISITNYATRGIGTRDVLATVFFSIPAIILALPLTILEMLFLRGGIITAYAHIRK